MSIKDRFADAFARSGLAVEEAAQEFGTSTRQVRRYLAGECNVPKLVAERMAQLAASRRSAFSFGGRPAFRFIDLFAGIGGLRIGFEAIGGRCVFTSEWDRWSQKTYRRTSPMARTMCSRATSGPTVPIPRLSLTSMCPC